MSTWAGTFYPHSHREQYRPLLEELAERWGFPREKWTAIEQQLSWGITKQRTVVHQNHCRIMVLNKAAALEAKFINYKDMPGYALLLPEVPEVVEPDDSGDDNE